MNINTISKDKTNRNISSFNIILADRDNDTFRRIQNLTNRFNFINLSSCFAVNFILEYEKIDLVIISKKISDLSNIIKRANRKKINVYILGRDVGYPINEKEIENLILKEIEKSTANERNKRFNLRAYFSNFLNLKKSTKVILKGKYKNSGESDRNKDRAEKEASEKHKEKVYSAEDCNNGSNKKEKENEDKEDSKGLKLDKKVKSQDENVSKENETTEIRKIKTLKQKIIVILKAKGGVGSTTISIFLSSVFNKIKTLLVDLNFSEGGGDISYYLSIPASPNILNFVDGYNRSSLDNSIIKINENLDVLQSPPTYDLSKKIDLQDIYCLADIAKKKYHMIIIDLPNKLDDLYLGVIDLADLLIMVSDNTAGSMGRLVRINDRFLCSDVEKVLIINKYDRLDNLNFFKNQIKHFFHLKNLIFLDENEMLRNKSEFLNFSFSNLKSFNYLAEKIFNLLTYD
jgi:MinD-like ATPase involved in chromosome partitioning or flagellar assembly